MGATDGGVAKMDVSLDDIIKQVRTPLSAPPRIMRSLK